MIGQAIQASQGNSNTNSSHFQQTNVPNTNPITTNKAPPIMPVPFHLPLQSPSAINPNVLASGSGNNSFVISEINKALNVNSNDEITAPGKQNNCIKTEKCYYKVRRISKNEAKFIGVYRGINTAKQIFLLMSRRHAEQFNNIATTWANSTEVLESFNTAMYTDDESYNSQISTEGSSNEYEDELDDTQKQMFETIYENRPSLCAKIGSHNSKLDALEQKREAAHSKLAVTRCHPNSAQQVPKFTQVLTQKPSHNCLEKAR